MSQRVDQLAHVHFTVVTTVPLLTTICTLYNQA